jgi:hypothetical protein
MTTAEIFLALWATIATVLAVLFHTTINGLKFKIVAILMSIDQVAHGKAVIEQVDGNVRIRSV